jgi:hypothetical protein
MYKIFNTKLFYNEIGVYYEMWQKQLRNESEGKIHGNIEENSKNAGEIEPPKTHDSHN